MGEKHRASPAGPVFFLDFYQEKSKKKLQTVLRQMTHSLFQGHSSFAQNRFGAVKSILLKRKRN
jgi:hypothetical protein